MADRNRTPVRGRKSDSELMPPPSCSPSPRQMAPETWYTAVQKLLAQVSQHRPNPNNSSVEGEGWDVLSNRASSLLQASHSFAPLFSSPDISSPIHNISFNSSAHSSFNHPGTGIGQLGPDRLAPGCSCPPNGPNFVHLARMFANPLVIKHTAKGSGRRRIYPLSRLDQAHEHRLIEDALNDAHTSLKV